MIRVADYVINRLYQEGAKHIFYVVGRQCFYLTDAIRRSQEKNEITGVAMHHEQCASMAALSYSLYNDEFGACLVTTGCGGTNAMTGILHAWQDSIPMIIISGQQEYANTVKASGLPLRQVGIQESDVESYAKAITKYAVTIDNANDIAYHLDKAILLAKTGRPGPVWLDIPMDIQNCMVNEDTLKRFDEQNEVIVPKHEDVEYIVEEIKRSKRPVLLAGHGVRTSRSTELLKSFARKNNIPVVFTRYANDIMEYHDRLNAGVVGASGCSRYGNFSIQNSDLVISLASKLSLETTGNRDEFARAAKKIVVDIDKIEHSKKGIRIDRFVYADVHELLAQLNQEDLCCDFSDWVAKCNHWKSIFEYTNEKNPENGMLDMKLVYQRISEIAPNGTTYLCDAGLTGSTVDVQTKNRGSQRILCSYSQGEMGYSLPGSIGVAAQIGAPVVAYCGDGSIMMNLQELQTIVRNNYNIKVVIINNNGYSSIRHGQTQYFRGKTISSDASNGLTLPDFGKIADAFGLRYLKIENYEGLDAKIGELFNDNLPLVCEFACDPFQCDLHNGLVTYGKRKFGFRPIEDQAPYIDRDLFFKEMIVEPLETSHGTPV
ncbi:acetolactate synthase-1/2/3 large subunit [Fibrobacter sp. UWH9]|uniref:thiamine pyrophosphate-binding protein n=1 Tax=Fibrobacter sp. UWH9 TaxID=1896213 RepID=UPI0009117028|nr:thiamine pyrophosphate-binding protein [Fibrobacter sp. UWH9]SHG32789.1 acetolactate synthase-1/2/3 large subunit [Fibrobacter sp. UWH9]